jgi:PTH1 family peptidyl-tRNA hydrolase
MPLIPVAAPTEIPQASTPQSSDDDSDESAVCKTRKQLRKEKARQKQEHDESGAETTFFNAAIHQISTLDVTVRDIVSQPTFTQPILPQSRKEKRQQKKQRHDSAHPTPTGTDTESPPTPPRKPPNNPPKSHAAPPATEALLTIPPSIMAKAAQTAYPLLICSIGNPGTTYASTLHSAGHIVTSTLSHAKGYKPFSKGLSGMVSQPQSSHMAFGILGFKRVQTERDVVEDWTFWQSTSLMNVSGNGVKRAYSEWLRDVRRQVSEASLEGRLVVVHDELESALGKITVRDGSASAKGHNGIKSCQEKLGGVKWWRVGVGIGRPESRDPNVVSKYVLGKMTSFQREKLEGCAVPVFKALEGIAAGKK